MKGRAFKAIVIFWICCILQSLSFNLSQVDKHGDVLSAASCNKDTVLDLAFNPNTVISNCTTSGCSLSNADTSTLNFLNVAGQQMTYTLQSATIYQTPGGVSRVEEKGMFLFGFEKNGQWVMMAVPFSDTIVNSSDAITYELNVDNDFDPAMSFLRTMTNQPNNSSGIPLSSFNFLNQLEYNMFYSVVDPSSGTTYLLSYFVVNNLDVNISNFPTNSTPFPSVGADYVGTADKLCWGAVSQGIFQTHMRQSYPLWTAMIGIFIYWIYYLTTNLITITCYDKRFENNKWTCWSIFSLHHLGHEEYFTKLSRQTMMLITFCWEGLILAVLYSNISYGQPPIMILWAAVIAVVTALVFPYILGYFFLNNIYKTNLHKFDVMNKMLGHFNKKDGTEQYQNELDDIEELLYGLYYWYYVIAFVFFVVCWVLAVHQMMQLPRNFYYLHRYWLASLAVAFGLEHLVIDPIMTLIFGNFRFYQIRGYYYDYQLGDTFKQLQE